MKLIEHQEAYKQIPEGAVCKFEFWNSGSYESYSRALAQGAVYSKVGRLAALDVARAAVDCMVGEDLGLVVRITHNETHIVEGALFEDSKIRRYMAVSATNANGGPDLFFCCVDATNAEVEQGDHYTMALEKAREAGYRPVMAYDEFDPGWDNLKKPDPWPEA